MKQKAWKSRIKKQCEQAGTYRPYFDSMITALSQLLEQKDKAYETFVDDGRITTEYTNKNGATNIVKNPKLKAWEELNQEALAYWQALGLSPAGLKKINENAMKSKPKSALAEALSGLK